MHTLVPLAVELVRDIGESDCEELGDGWLVQPVNALTSLAYVGIGVAVVIGSRRAQGSGGRPGLGRASTEAWVYGFLLAAVGFGSVAFHGPQPTGARVMHDLPILLVVAFIVASNVQLLRPTGPSMWAMFSPAAVVATATMVVSVDAGMALTGLGVAGIALSEVLIARRRLRRADSRRQRRASIAIIAVAAVAASTWLLGRTDSPTCDPDSVLQVHGLWHALSAFVFGLWWWLANPSEVSSEPVTEGRRSDPVR